MAQPNHAIWPLYISDLDVSGAETFLSVGTVLQHVRGYDAMADFTEKMVLAERLEQS